MRRRIKQQLGLVFLVASFAVVWIPVAGAAGSGRHATTPLAGPWYTPQELKALVAYSNASFAQKKALLAGAEVTVVSGDGDFHWSDAGIGAGVAVGAVLLAGGLMAWLARTRSRRRLRHT